MENGKVTAEALEAVNQIRRRAYGRNTMVASEFDYKQSDCPSVNALLDLIMKERGYEFQVEGKRRLELKRTGKAAEIIKVTKGLDIDV